MTRVLLKSCFIFVWNLCVYLLGISAVNYMWTITVAMFLSCTAFVQLLHRQLLKVLCQ